MVLNGKGQVFFYTIMLGSVIIVLALALVTPIKQYVSDVTNSTTSDGAKGLDCSNSTISDYQKAQCVLVDLATPYFFFGLLAIAGIVIGAKLLFGEVR